MNDTCGTSRWRVCYQRGLPRLAFKQMWICKRLNVELVVINSPGYPSETNVIFWFGAPTGIIHLTVVNGILDSWDTILETTPSA